MNGAYLARRHPSALAIGLWALQEFVAGPREFMEGLSLVIVQKNARHRHVLRATGIAVDGELFRGADGKPRPERAKSPRTFEGLRCIRARRSSRVGLHCTLYEASRLLCTDSVGRRNRVRSASQHSVASVSQQKFAERVQTANSLSESLQHTRACSPRKTSR